MLTINLKEHEFYDGQKEMFFYTNPITVRLEHSLISISKWESHWQKPYLPSTYVKGISGYAEEKHYIQCMIIGSVPDYVPDLIMAHHAKEFKDYIAHPMTASSVHHRGPSTQGTSRQTVTSELIYYWMIKFGIPFECDRWHFNRLIMLIEVCGLKAKQESKSDAMTPSELARHRNQLNKARRGGK